MVATIIKPFHRSCWPKSQAWDSSLSSIKAHSFSSVPPCLPLHTERRMKVDQSEHGFLVRRDLCLLGKRFFFFLINSCSFQFSRFQKSQALQRMVEPWAQGQTACMKCVTHFLFPKVGIIKAYAQRHEL